MAQKREGIVVPRLETEAEEAQWWYDNRGKVEEAVITAMGDGTIRRAPPVEQRSPRFQKRHHPDG
jgi:hypothetical protein